MEDKKKIYFIYSNAGDENNIKKFELNQYIKKVKEIEKKIENGNIQILYCVEISTNNKEEEVKLFLEDNNGKKYFSNVPLNTLKLLGKENVDTDDIVNFELKFQNKEENNLYQIILSPVQQFYMFENNFKNKDENLINCVQECLSKVSCFSNIAKNLSKSEIKKIIKKENLEANKDEKRIIKKNNFEIITNSVISMLGNDKFKTEKTSSPEKGDQKRDPEWKQMEKSIKRNEQSEKLHERKPIRIGHGEGIGKEIGQAHKPVIP